MSTGWTFGQMTLTDPQVYAKRYHDWMAGIIAGQLGEPDSQPDQVLNLHFE